MSVCVRVQAEDLVWSRDVPAEVLLQRNPLRRATLSRAQHAAARALPPPAHVSARPRPPHPPRHIPPNAT